MDNGTYLYNVVLMKVIKLVSAAQRNALLRKALREAMEKRERVPLEEAILDFLYFKVKDKDDDLPKAMAQLDVIKTQSGILFSDPISLLHS